MILWLLNSWISYIVHAALIAGVIGTFFGSIIARIPVIGNYGAIVKTVALPLLIVKSKFTSPVLLVNSIVILYLVLPDRPINGIRLSHSIS